EIWMDVTFGDPVVAAAGDISCNCNDYCTFNCKNAVTASVVQAINPNYVITLGDNQYENSDIDSYRGIKDGSNSQTCSTCPSTWGYNNTWGAFLAKTYPTIGNHEYQGNNTVTCGSGTAQTWDQYLHNNYATYFDSTFTQKFTQSGDSCY